MAVVIEDSGGKTTSALLFTGVKNCSEIKRKVITDYISACLIRADYILDVFQVQCAVKKALASSKNGTMKTRKVTTEVLYQLSPNKNIGESLRTFAARDSEENIVVVLIDDEEDRNLTLLQESIVGEQARLDKLCELADVKSLQKIFQIAEKELKVSSLLDSIVTRMAVKDVV